mmetsp:Transcript_47059/g.117388  ORF Transcript_47059/g.117388 Transcript_47059/m.117388 type:complete len:217 (+) Transcript_47059:1994-2644(+)
MRCPTSSTGPRCAHSWRRAIAEKAMRVTLHTTRRSCVWESPSTRRDCAPGSKRVSAATPTAHSLTGSTSCGRPSTTSRRTCADTGSRVTARLAMRVVTHTAWRSLDLVCTAALSSRSVRVRRAVHWRRSSARHWTSARGTSRRRPPATRRAAPRASWAASATSRPPSCPSPSPTTPRCPSIPAFSTRRPSPNSLRGRTSTSSRRGPVTTSGCTVRR